MNQNTTSEIHLKIDLDDSKIPKRITWKASDTGEREKECKAFMLSIWDAAEKNTLRIDLWTKDMRIDEMTSHFFQTLVTLAESYERATSVKIAGDVKQFCQGLSGKIEQQLSIGKQS